MASQKQIDANRRNAKRSTGPITEAGKAVAKFNALRHGMTAESAVLPYEDPVSYAQLRDALKDHYAPANIAEEMNIEVVVSSYSRLLRSRRVETSAQRLGIQALKQRNGKNPAPRHDDDDALAVFMLDSYDNTRNMERYHGAIERSYFRAVETLRKVQNDRLREERRTTADRNRSGFVSRQDAKTIIVPEIDPTYAPPVRVWLHPEDENQPPTPSEPAPEEPQPGAEPHA